MVKSIQLVYEFDLRYNRLQSTFDQDIRLVDKMAIINQAYRTVYDKLVLLAETDAYYRKALEPLEEKEQRLSLVRKGTNFDIYAPAEDEYKQMRLRVKAIKDGCKEKDIVVRIFQSDDLDDALANSWWKPDFAWEMCIGDSGKEGYYIWHNNDFQINEAICDYYVKPQELHCPSLSDKGYYVDWNGITRTVDVDLILDKTFIFDMIIDVAVLIARSIKGDVRDFELQLNKIINIEKINK